MGRCPQTAGARRLSEQRRGIVRSVWGARVSSWPRRPAAIASTATAPF